MKNEAAKKLVIRFIAEKDPGYALLIDAPWGSGKTFTIKNIISREGIKDALYVTLYDVHSPEAFEWALVRALKPWADNKKSKYFQQFKNLLSGLSILGVSADLSRISLTEIVLQDLPKILIFDDIERCGLGHEQLSGLINRFVEHQKKNVILIANTEKHADKDTFDATREKLVGQTVTLKSDIDAAIEAAWLRIPEGVGRDVLKVREDIIKRIFEESSHQNLRLLLRAMRDAAACLNSLTPEFIEFDDAIDRLVMSFIALHMAYHGGELNKDDMRARARLSGRGIFPSKQRDDVPKDQLEIVQERHPECNILQSFRDVLPVQLAYSLIVEGYAAPDSVRSSLRATNQFSKPIDQPDWVRLWEWYKEPVYELEKVIERIAKRQKNLEINEPGEILQIHAAINFIDKFLLKEDRRNQARKTYDYINRLVHAGKIRASVPSVEHRTRYGFEIDTGRISFGGYVFEPDRRDRLLVCRIKMEMDKVFEENLESIQSKLLEKLRSDPEGFITYFRYENPSENFVSTPILHHLEPEEFSRILLEHFDANRDIARVIARNLSERRKKHRIELSLEQPWFEQLDEALVNQAKAKSELYAGQIRLFIRRDLMPS